MLITDRVRQWMIRDLQSEIESDWNAQCSAVYWRHGIQMALAENQAGNLQKGVERHTEKSEASQ